MKEYAHTKVPKGIQNQEFQKIVEENKSDINPNIQLALQFLMKDNINIPRKKTTFIKFLLHSSKFKLSENEREVAWNILEKYLNKIKAEKKNEQPKKTNDSKKNKINENGDGKMKKAKANSANGTNKKSKQIVEISTNENSDNSGKKKRKLKNAEETTEENSGKSKKKKRKSETVEELNITENNTNDLSVADTEKSVKKMKRKSKTLKNSKE